MPRQEFDQVTGVRWIDYRTDVPSWLAEEIGHVAVQWSRLEAHFEEAIRLLMPVDIHIGRIAVAGMNIRARTLTATNLVRVHVFYGKLSKDMHTEIKEICRDITNQELNLDRNKLVHGLWGRVGGHWELVRTSGVCELDSLGKFARPLLPQRERMNRKKTRSIRNKIKKLCTRVQAFCFKIEVALGPLPYKSRREIRLSRPNRVRSNKADAAWSNFCL